MAKTVKPWQWIVPLALFFALWFMPCPAGLKPQAWHMFAIFISTIIAILTSPLPSGALHT